MTLMQLADGTVFLYDCNITEDTGEAALDYIASQIGEGADINVFVCSHRDADHICGIKHVHERFPIQRVWDSGVEGTSPDGDEHEEYMDLCADLDVVTVKANKFWDYGPSRLRVMNAANDALPDDPNGQSIVIKVEHHDANGRVSSVMLTGDSDAETWQDIRRRYNAESLSSSLLLASHHGSLSFFDDPNDDRYYYIKHLEAIRPAMTIVSVGENPHGHPDPTALKLYAKYSTGSNKGNKLVRTDEDGVIRVTLKDGAAWLLQRNQ